MTLYPLHAPSCSHLIAPAQCRMWNGRLIYRRSAFRITVSPSWWCLATATDRFRPNPRKSIRTDAASIHRFNDTALFGSMIASMAIWFVVLIIRVLTLDRRRVIYTPAGRHWIFDRTLSRARDVKSSSGSIATFVTHQKSRRATPDTAEAVLVFDWNDVPIRLSVYTSRGTLFTTRRRTRPALRASKHPFPQTQASP